MVFEWRRPENIPFPSVWCEFKAKDIESDNLITYRVQDLPVDRFEDAIDHLVTHFVRDEPWYASLDFYNDRESMDEFIAFTRLMLEQKIVLACFREGSDDIAGLNVVAITNGSINFEATSKYFAPMRNAGKFMLSKFNIFEKYGVDKYMTSIALSVDPKYRNRGIGRQLLKSRIPLGKAIGVTLTATVFSAIESQRASYKVGFEVVYKISYEDLLEAGFDFPMKNSEFVELSILSLE